MLLRTSAFAFLLALAAFAAPAAEAAGSSTRFGIEGQLLAYDETRSVFKVKVTKPKVSGGFGTGGIAGQPPKGIAKGDEIELEVVPEGSVLKRTVIKGSQGGGLDTSGTQDGFKRAVAAIPRDQDVVLSFEENPKKGDGPKYLLKMVQIRMTPEEIAERLQQMGIDPDEIEDAAE
jgi:hypothetical protein